jgi:hypothetical protein
MLTERLVLSRLKRHLEARGYTNIVVVNGRVHGDDLVATSPSGKFKLHVEAKGQTSSFETSRRYGKAFSSAQIRDHMAQAIYKALCMRAKSRPDARRRIALALPDIPSKRNVYKPVTGALEELGIGVFWIGADKSVKLRAPWRL